MRRSSARSFRTFRRFTVLLLAVLFGSVVFTAAIPAASAQAPPDYERDFFVPPGTSCPAGSIFIGQLVGSTAAICRPAGYTPIRDFDQCLQAGSVFWSASGSVCSQVITTFRSRVSGCFAWEIPVTEAIIPSTGSIVFEGQDACAQPLLIRNGEAITQSHLIGRPVCIEDARPQADAPTGQVGTIFRSDGITYLIHTGEPTCSFNCVDGFDINCDGKIGDFCPVEIDRSTVAGVAECLALTADAAGASDVVESVPAIASAPPIPVGPQLAHSGSESTALAYLGAGLVAFGAVAMGTRRRLGH